MAPTSATPLGSVPTDSPPLPSADGLDLAPFLAVRYAAADLAPVTSPPYDVIDEATLDQLEQASPHNVVRLILPRGEPGGPASRYRRAADTLAAWRAAGVLVPDPAPALYVYEESAGGHVQRGLLGAVALSQPEEGVILPHENTMAGPVADRLALTEATGANLEPIFLVYAGGGAAAAVVRSRDEALPLVEATTDDGLRHRLWRVDKPADVSAVRDDLRTRRATIADGHHRYATYLRHQADRHAAGAGPGPWDRGLAFLVDAAEFGPQVHPIHRVVPGMPPSRAAQLAATAFAVDEVPAGPSSQGCDDGVGPALDLLAKVGRDGPAVLLVGAGAAYLVHRPAARALAAAIPAGRSAAWRELDVTVAAELLMRSCWSRPDGEGVGYHHDVPSALAEARRTGGTALLLNATPVAAVVAVAAAGERMPRKSTLFTPKPRTGVVLRVFADQPG